MLLLKDLWIGDTIRNKRNGRTGTFEGIHKSGKARLKSFGRIYLVTANDLERYEPPEQEIKLNLNQSQKVSNLSFGDSIDLHIEKLRPKLSNALPERIIDIQIKTLIAFVEDAIEKSKYEIIIIHGKGTGVLRQTVQEVLKSYDAVNYTELINQGGATLVRF